MQLQNISDTGASWTPSARTFFDKFSFDFCGQDLAGKKMLFIYAET
jgi:hypothetical protein